MKKRNFQKLDFDCLYMKMIRLLIRMRRNLVNVNDSLKYKIVIELLIIFIVCLSANKCNLRPISLDLS